MLESTFETIIEQDFAIAYLKLLGQMYYKHITVTMLVEAAGYGRATFYAYFSGLKDLRQKLNACDIAETKQICEKAMEISDNEERTQSLIDNLIPHFKLFWTLMCSNNMPEHLEDMKICLHDVFKDRFYERFKDGKFDSVLVGNFCIGGMLHMMVKLFESGDDAKSPQVVTNMVELINHMLF